MWDMRRSVDPAVFPDRRVVVQFEYPEAPQGHRDWWLISENGEVDLCMNDPGGEIDVFGDTILTAKLGDWLQSSGLPKLGTIDPPEINWKIA